MDCNSAAPIGVLLIVGREVSVGTGQLQPLQRNDGGVYVAGATGGSGVFGKYHIVFVVTKLT